MADVVIDVDVVVFDPDGIAELERHRRKLPVHHPGEVKAVGNELLYLLVKVAFVAVRKFEEQEAATCIGVSGVSRCTKEASKLLRCSICSSRLFLKLWCLRGCREGLVFRGTAFRENLLACHRRSSDAAALRSETAVAHAPGNGRAGPSRHCRPFCRRSVLGDGAAWHTTSGHGAARARRRRPLDHRDPALHLDARL